MHSLLKWFSIQYKSYFASPVAIGHQVKIGNVRLPFLILVALCSGSLLWGKEDGFFDSDKAVDFRLEAPLAELRKQRGAASDLEWIEGKLIYTNAQGEEAELRVGIRARGNFRRKRVNCFFPPYWINFRKSEVKGTPFAGLDKVKVVSHCNSGKKRNEPYLYSEYLAYKTYNMLTDLSFQVRLATIDYHDTDRDKSEGAYAAFFIEHTNSLEKRLGAKQVKDQFVLPSRYDLSDLCLAEMFQFFIGNTDFSYFASEEECCHNAKVFHRKKGDKGLFPVPYDFDISGIVSAPYAAPNPNFPIKSVKDRLYRGVEIDHDIITATVRRFIDQKEAIYELWETFELLDPKRRLKALGFIDDFYRIFDKDTKARRIYILELRAFDVMERIIQESIDKEKIRAEKEKRRLENRARSAEKR